MASYWFEPQTVALEVGGRTMTLETGRMAKQAAGAVVVTYGETVVLVTAARANPRAGHRLLSAGRRLRREDLRGGQDPGRLLQARRRASRIARFWSVASSTARSGRSFPRSYATRPRSSRRCSRRMARTQPRHAGLRRRLGGAVDLAAALRGADRRGASGPRRGEFVVNPTHEQMRTATSTSSSPAAAARS